MTATPPNQEAIEAWKAKYLEKGLPETLLDAMIAEAELEWESVLGWGQINRLAWLNVKIADPTANNDTYYWVLVIINMRLFNGQLLDGNEAPTLSTDEFKFAQVPCVDLSVIVYRVPYDELIPDEFGLANLSHSKDEDLTVTLQEIPTEEQCDKFKTTRMFEPHINEIPVGDKTLNITLEHTIT